MMRLTAWMIVFLAGLALTPAARADDAQGVIFLELFASQSLATSPPADRLLGDLAAWPGIIALDCHVTSFDQLGWKDTMSLPACTDMQNLYKAARGGLVPFVPEMIVNGRKSVTGSDKSEVEAAMARARKLPVIGLSRDKDQNMIHVDLPPVPGAPDSDIVLAPYEKTRAQTIGAGENKGQTLNYTHTVTLLATVDKWRGIAQTRIYPLFDIRLPLAVFAYDPQTGAIVAAGAIEK